MTRVFISSSGTEIGKTFVTCALISQLRAAGHSVAAVKPVATGYDPLNLSDGDSGELLTALGRDVDTGHVEEITPWRFSAALSPDMAAAREQRTVPFTDLVDFCAAHDSTDVTLIEGIGGIMVPLDARHTVLDWMEALAAPIVLVVGGYLGTLSHTLTAVETLRSRSQEIAGIVVNESKEQPVSLLTSSGDSSRRQQLSRCRDWSTTSKRPTSYR